MKQNGMRLVQRKFAQGVPIPSSSASVAPAPPERRQVEQPASRSVYQNNLSARSLLDLVSMQNIHRHKQEPLVLLERLRSDAIPSPPAAPAPRARVRRVRALPRRKGARGDMCLRSGKRKSTDAAKGQAKKRKKLSSESTDDIPLVYIFERIRPKITDKKGKPSERAKRTPAPKRSARSETPASGQTTPSVDSRASDESNFTFKEPARPVRLSYPLYKKNKAAAGTARQAKKGAGEHARWAGLRSARAPSEARGAVRRLRSKVLLSKKPPIPAVRKAGPKTNKDFTTVSPPRATGFKVPRPPLPAKRVEPATPRPGPSRSEPPTPPSAEHDFKISNWRRESLDSANQQTICVAHNTPSSCSCAGCLVERPLEVPPPPSPSPNQNNVSQEVEDWCIAIQQANVQRASPATSELSDMIKLVPPLQEPSVEREEGEGEGEREFMKEIVNGELVETRSQCSEDMQSIRISQVRSVEDVPVEPPKRVKGKGVGKKSVPKDLLGKVPRISPVDEGEPAQAAPKPKKTLPKRAAKTAAPPAEASTSTRLLRNMREPPPPPPPSNPDVYEFDAELEASRPPSGLRRRDPAQTTAAGLTDSLPTTSDCDKIKTEPEPEPEPEPGNPEEDLYTRQKHLIENLTSSPALMKKLFNCLPTELQDELGSLAPAEGSRDEAFLHAKPSSVFEAPTFHPTAEEFQDPIKYYEKIAKEASEYGLCKIVPPADFKPACTLSESIRFAVVYQYIFKMYNRWGAVTRELAAIKAYLRAQSVVFGRSPLLDGSEISLPKLFHVVERHGGLSEVMEHKRWRRVADEMKFGKLQQPERKLDSIYMRFLVPYATLSDKERQAIMRKVEKGWTTKYQQMLLRARNPLQRQQRMLGAEGESESDDEAEDPHTAGALQDAEDCIVQGRAMNLHTFKKIATTLMDAHFEPGKKAPTAADVEKVYWRAVLLGTDHIVADTASIDTGEDGYGFQKDPEAEYGSHPWNLKALARNPNNVLRYLGDVLGVTVPTLHLSMLFSTSCWHRDPHGLPWVEYLHQGADKIWYGIPREQTTNFRNAVEALCPAFCQNKPIWLASEITMIPPSILSEHGVTLSRVLQKPGEYVMVFPEAHSCSISTGFAISESVYFASNTWLTEVYKLFQEVRNSCEPTMFSLEQLLLNGSADEDAPPPVRTVLATLLGAELEHRRELEGRGLKVVEMPPQVAQPRAWNARAQNECDYCRCTLYLSKVTGLTGRNAAVCSDHALGLLGSKKFRNSDLSGVEFLSSFSTPALEEMLDRLEARCAESRAPSVVDLTGPDGAE